MKFPLHADMRSMERQVFVSMQLHRSCRAPPWLTTETTHEHETADPLAVPCSRQAVGSARQAGSIRPGCATPAAPPTASPGRRRPWRSASSASSRWRALQRGAVALVSHAASISAAAARAAAAPRPGRSSAAGRPGRRPARPWPGSASGCRTAARSICWRSCARPRRSPMPKCTSLTSSRSRCAGLGDLGDVQCGEQPVGGWPTLRASAAGTPACTQAVDLRRRGGLRLEPRRSAAAPPAPSAARPSAPSARPGGASAGTRWWRAW